MIDFLLIAAPRTGSNHLCTLLNSDPSITAHYEIFHRDGIFLASGTNASREFKNLTIEDRDRNRVEFLENLKRFDSERKVGFKIFPSHADTMMHFLLEERSIKKILLYRSNILALYASDLIANNQNKFVTLKGEDSSQGKVEFLPEKFEKFEEFLTAWFQEAMFRIASTGQSYFFMPYEKVNDQAMLAGLTAYITEAPSQGKLQSSHVKSGTIDVLQRFSNPDIVNEYLEGRQLQLWRYDSPG